MRPARHSDGTHNVPQQQIVGFHVEGQSPSPSPSSILQDSLRTISTGSPTPVIIPPQFQVGREPLLQQQIMWAALETQQQQQQVTRPAAVLSFVVLCLVCLQREDTLTRSQSTASRSLVSFTHTRAVGAAIAVLLLLLPSCPPHLVCVSPFAAACCC